MVQCSFPVFLFVLYRRSVSNDADSLGFIGGFYIFGICFGPYLGAFFSRVLKQIQEKHLATTWSRIVFLMIFFQIDNMFMFLHSSTVHLWC